MFDGIVAVAAVANVACDQQAALAFGFHHALGVFGVLVFVEIHDRDVRAFTGEVHRRGATDATVAATDQRDLAG